VTADSAVAVQRSRAALTATWPTAGRQALSASGATGLITTGLTASGLTASGAVGEGEGEGEGEMPGAACGDI
jgi:hypothetical protein